MMISNKYSPERSCTWRTLKAAALVVSLGLSTCSIYHAVGSSDHAWVGWVALLPLFISIRVLAPAQAMAAGAFWGLCLFVSPAITGDSIFSLGAGSFVLLTTLPGIYTWLGAHLTRQVGFSPFLLALGWMGVELALAPQKLQGRWLQPLRAANPQPVPFGLHVQPGITGLSEKLYVAQQLQKPQSWVHNCETANRRVDVTEFIAWCAACGLKPLDGFVKFLKRSR